MSNVRVVGVRIVLLALAALSVLPGVGCTHTYTAKITPFSAYPAGEPMPLTVSLRLSPEFKGYTWKKNILGDNFVLPLGPTLCENSDAMARRLFRSVVPEGGVADATLTPRVVAVERTMGTWAFGEASTLISVEWTLADAAGSPVWVQTVDGVGTALNGNLFTHHEESRKQVQGAVDALFLTTYQQIAAAPEVRGLRPNGP